MTPSSTWWSLAAILLFLTLAGCAPGEDVVDDPNPFAPSVDPDGEAVDGMIVGHRLMEAGEYHLALEAYTRAAGQKGINAETLTALGSVNLALGRLNQAEGLLRRAVELDPEWAEAWNNLGVLLMEKGETSEASLVFKKAYALDNGQNDSIRDNLRLALAKLENSRYDPEQEEEFRLVRRGSGSYQIRRNDV